MRRHREQAEAVSKGIPRHIHTIEGKTERGRRIVRRDGKKTLGVLTVMIRSVTSV